MILCHKCGGLLATEDVEDTTGLLDCQCISGYVRGFEPALNRTEAIAAQIKAQEGWLALYERQGRSQAECDKVIIKVLQLMELR